MNVGFGSQVGKGGTQSKKRREKFGAGAGAGRLVQVQQAREEGRRSRSCRSDRSDRSAAQRNGNGNGEQVDGEWWVCRLQCISACAVQAAVHEDGASTVCLLGWFFSWPVDPRLQSEALAD